MPSPKKYIIRNTIRLLLLLAAQAIFSLAVSGTAAAITADEPIAGISSVSAGKLEEALASINPGHIHPDIAYLYIKWGNRFGIKADLAFAQMLHETNYLRYTGDVRPWQNNFAGIGATGGGNPGNSFPNAEAGVIAHYAHLAWYLFPNHVNEYCNDSWDPRHFGPGHRNNVRTLRDLGGKWAVPGINYGNAIASIASGIWDYSDTSYYPPIIGSLDGIAMSGPGELNVSGWAIDPNTTDPIAVHVYVDGQPKAAITANISRSDVGFTYLRFGANHGYSASVGNIASGSHIVCAYGINTGAGGNALIGCKTVSVPVNPFGSLDGVAMSAPGQIRLDGWAIDPDIAGPIDVHVYLDGRYVDTNPVTAGGARTDVGAVYPGFGANHGYSASVGNIASGSHTVCAYGINSGPGGNALLGCKAVNVPVNPFGNLDGVSVDYTGQISLGGWAIDPNTTDPIDVHVYVNGKWGGALTANVSRPDVGAVFPAYGAGHGFSGSVQARASNNTVCAYGINVGAGGNILLGCKVVNVAVNPFGSLDGVAAGAPGQIDLGGWAIDPNTSEAIGVHVYVNGRYADALTAGTERTDIGNIYPVYGAGHGFSGSVPVAAQSNTVCVYGINVDAGGNALLGCKVV